MEKLLHMRIEKFEPENSEKKMLKFTRGRLEKRLPKNSISNATITKIKDGFRAKLRVQTKRGIFYIQAKAENLKQLNARIQEKLKARLHKYKDQKTDRRDKQRHLGNTLIQRRMI